MKLKKRNFRIVMMLVALLLIVPGLNHVLAVQTATKYPAAETYKPTPVPDRIVLTWKGDTATTQAVSWRTDDSVITPQAQIAVAEDGPSFKQRAVTVFPEKSEVLETNLGYSSKFHSVNFENLAPNTKYLYRVGDGANWSEWFEFTTGSDKVEPFSFVYVGDAQNDIREHWSRVIRQSFSDMPDASFILHAGDLINHGNADEQWGEWFDAGGWINGMIPSIATPGNHEYARIDGSQRQLSEYWDKQFAFPNNGPEGLKGVAYWDYQGMRIISLDTNLGSSQMQETAVWLDNVLEENTNEWTAITFHHPLFSSGAGRDNKALRELLLPIIEKHSVDLVLQGHDHTYARGHISNKQDGKNIYFGDTMFANSVSGPKMYNLSDEVWKDNGAYRRSGAEQTQLYQLIYVNNNVLTYEARTATGELYDSFEMKKLPNGKKQIKELVNTN